MRPESPPQYASPSHFEEKRPARRQTHPTTVIENRSLLYNSIAIAKLINDSGGSRPSAIFAEIADAALAAHDIPGHHGRWPPERNDSESRAAYEAQGAEAFHDIGGSAPDSNTQARC